MSEADEAPVVALHLQVKQHQRAIGVACRSRRPRQGFADKSPCQTLTAYQFLDNDELTNLDTLLLSLAPSACYMSLGSGTDVSKAKGDLKKVLAILKNRGVEPVHTKPSVFKTDQVIKQLERLLSDGASTDGTRCSAIQSLELDKPLAVPCVAALISELRLMKMSGASKGGDDDDDDEEGGDEDEDKAEGRGLESGDGSHDLKMGSLESFMRLDSAAADAVCLLPDKAFPVQNGSLFQILNQCRTKMGSRMLERWLRQPLVDKAAIEERYDIVELLKNATAVRGALRDGPLKVAPDLDTLKAKVSRRKAGLADVYRLYRFVLELDRFETALSDFEGTEEEVALLETKFTKPFRALEKEFGNYTKLVENVLDMSQIPDYIVNPSYSERLTELKAEMDEVREEIDSLYEEARDGWCKFKEGKCTLETDKHRGFVLRLSKANLEKDLKSRKKTVETISVLKNGVHFTTPELSKLGRTYVILRKDYEDEQGGLVGKAVDTAATYLPVVEAVAALVSELDVLASFAEVAALAPKEYVRPVLRERGDSKGGVLKLEKARHPCLEWQEDIEYMPNGYDMTKDEGRFLIITGPNMGGKSTYIRTLGAIVVMAQVGAFVPCDSAEMSIMDAVFARVGAGDAQQRGISTFMSEMLEASAILTAATSDSLIIIDELGRGTSTFDGFGLAWAISEYIIDHTKAFCLFATHFHEMTTLPKCRPCAQNWHVSALAELDKITMLYELKEGPCLQSFGIHVATMAGFPASVARDAKRKAALLEDFKGLMTEDEERAMSKKQRVGLGGGGGGGQQLQAEERLTGQQEEEGADRQVTQTHMQVSGGDSSSASSSSASDAVKAVSVGAFDYDKLHKLVGMVRRLPLDMEELEAQEKIDMFRQLVDKMYVRQS